MTDQTNQTITMKDLPFREQVAVALIELLNRVVDGTETMARVDHVVSDLYYELPWHLYPADVAGVIDRVAHYGISELPGYEGQDSE